MSEIFVPEVVVPGILFLLYVLVSKPFASIVPILEVLVPSNA